MSALRPIPELPIAMRSAGMRWLLADERWRGLAESVGQIMQSPDPRSLGVEIFKQHDRRLVFRVKLDGDSAVAKSFPLRRVRHMLFRARRYGPASLRNLVQAARLALPVPRLYAYGERRTWGLIQNSVLVMEDLTPLLTAAQKLRAASDDDERREILSLVAQLLIQLYRAGCNHVDIAGTNILISADNRIVRIIDLQYVRFLGHKSPSALMAQASRFRLSCAYSHLAEEPILAEWIEALLAAAGLRKEDGWLDMYDRFFFHPPSLRKRLSLR